ncbi:Synaptobrevin, partial [Trachymyrmex zeteki]
GCEATSRPFIDQSQAHVRNRRGWRVVRRPCSLERSTLPGKSIYCAIEGNVNKTLRDECGDENQSSKSCWQSLAKSYAPNAERPTGGVAEQADRQIDRNRKSPRRSTTSSMATEGGLAPDAAAGAGAGTDGIVGGPRTPQQIASQKRLQATQAQVDEVVDIMKTNVEKVLERDQKLSELDDRADALQQGASQFEQQAGKLKRKFWLQNLKMMIIMGVIGLIVLAIIVVKFMPESAPAPPAYNYPPGMIPQGPLQGAAGPGAAAGGAGGTGAATGGGSPQTAGAALVGNLNAGMHSVV